MRSVKTLVMLGCFAMVLAPATALAAPGKNGRGSKQSPSGQSKKQSPKQCKGKGKGKQKGRKCGKKPGKPPAPPLQGRMTGGGHLIGTSLVTGAQFKVTYGMGSIRCGDTKSTLQVNWPEGSFHTTGLVQPAECSDDPTIEPEPPAAPFDTITGMGEGRLRLGGDKQAGFVTFDFRDGGQPSPNFTTIRVFDRDGTLVMEASGQIDGGNNQAHRN